MRRGGYATVSEAGLSLEHRDALYERMMSLGEGALFRMEDIATSPEEESDFVDMRNHDYIHVVDGYCTAIIETEYLRRHPKMKLFLSAYTKLRGCTLAETGDRVAWKLRLKEFEPLKGYRFYSNGPAEILAFGHMSLQILPSTPWLMDDSEPARLFRAYHDMEPKERTAALARSPGLTHLSDAMYEETLAWHAKQNFSGETPGDLSPDEVALLIEQGLEKRTPSR